MLEIGHNSLALLGLAVVAALVFAAGRDELRTKAESFAYAWLHSRQEVRPMAVADESAAVPGSPTTAAAAGAAGSKALTREQAAVASWIARRYKVAPEPIGALVLETWAIGQRAGLDPTLLLAIMAVESSFNPFAQSPVGAQGLMQVMTRVHDDKYRRFGGTHAAFDPVSNLRVGVQVLKECIARAGSLHDGLKHYVGAALIEGDGGYVGRVLAEQGFMRKVADGKGVPVNAINVVPATRDAAPQPAAMPLNLPMPAAPAPAAPVDAERAEQVALLD